MQEIMKKRPRLVGDEELPPINFSLMRNDLDIDEPAQLQRQEPFFKSFFDGGVVSSKQPDLKKKLIVQTKRLEENDLSGYNKANFLKEN